MAKLNDKEQAKLDRAAAETRKAAIADSELLSNLADKLTSKLKGQGEEFVAINKLRSDLAKNLADEVDNLENQKKLIEDYTKELSIQQTLIDKRKKGRNELVTATSMEVDMINKAITQEEKRVELQDALQSKADGMLDTLESQVKNIPLVGDMLASTIDFGGLKKEMGGILGGVAQNFTKLTGEGMAVGPAIAKSFGGAIKSIGPLLTKLAVKIYALMGPIMLGLGAMYILKKTLKLGKEIKD